MVEGQNKYYTCQEIIEAYKEVKLWGWNVNKIGAFYNCLLLDGKRIQGNKKTLITESSFLRLMEFVYSSLDISPSKEEYIGYEEVLESVPQAIFYRWSPTLIGMFYNSNLLQGKKCCIENRNLVTLQSVQRLIQYTSERFRNIANL